MEEIGNKKLIILFMMVLFSINFVAAEVSFQLQFDGANIDHGVITKEFKILLSNSAENDLSVDFVETLTLLTRGFGVDTYNWTLGTSSGTRTFILGDETFTIDGKSEVEEIFDHVGSIDITINQNDSTVSIGDLDLTGATNEFVNFDFNEFSGRFSLQNIMNGIGLNFTFKTGNQYPTYNFLSLSGRAYTIMDDIVIFNQGTLTFPSIDNALSNNILFNELIDIYGLTGSYSVDTTVIKSGTDYTFFTNEGYGSLNSITLQRIRDLITNGTNLVSPTEITSYLSPYFDLTPYLDNVTWDTNVDLSSLELTDGTYSIPLILIDKHGNENTETIILTLNIQSNEEQVVTNSTYIPSNEEILDQIQEISGLPDGDTVSVAVFGSTLPPEFEASSEPTGIDNSISYIEINLSSSTTGSYKINFSVANTFDKNLIKAYVFEGGTWKALPTTFIKEESGKFFFYFEVTHFSQFLIAEDEASNNSGGGGRSSCRTTWDCAAWSSCVDGLQIRECSKIKSGCRAGTQPEGERACALEQAQPQGEPEPLIIGNPGQEEGQKGFFSGLTGAVVGTLGTGGTFVVALVLVGSGAVAYILVRNKKLELKKESAKAKRKDKKKGKK